MLSSRISNRLLAPLAPRLTRVIGCLIVAVALTVCSHPTKAQSSHTKSVLFSGFSEVGDLELVDVTNDGLLDILLVSPTAPCVRYYAAYPDGTFRSTPWTIGNPAATAAEAYAKLGDYDGDGDDDIIVVRVDGAGAWTLFSVQRVGIGWDSVEVVIASGSSGTETPEVVEDLNGDGRGDIVTWVEDGNTGVFTIYWRASLPAGGFGPRQMIVSSSFEIWPEEAFDFDADGDLDLLWGTAQGDEARIQLNTGAGSFASTPLTISGINGDADLVDLNGDGLKDIFSVDSSTTSLLWAANTGAASFAPAQVIDASTDDAYARTFADIDADGLTDIISSRGWNNEIVWYKNTGSGTFGARQNLISPVGQAESLTSGNIDSGGAAEVICFSWLSGTLELVTPELTPSPTQLSETFETPELITTNSMIFDTRIVDMDGDFDQDIVYFSWNPPYIDWAVNQGDGSFTNGPDITQWTVPIAVTLSSWTGGVGDLDGDGKPDVAYSEYYGPYGAWLSPGVWVNYPAIWKIRWAPNLGGGNFPTQSHTLIAQSDPASIRPHVEAIVDIDGDGDKDILLHVLLATPSDSFGVGSPTTPCEIRWMSNLGGGIFSPMQVLAAFPTNVAVNELPVDVDADGDVDIMIVDAGTLSYLINDGAGNFLLSAPLSVNCRKAKHFDVDGDGDLDLVTITKSGNEVMWLASNGSGSYAAAVTLIDFGLAGGITNIEMADFSGNGVLDAVLANSTATLRQLTFHTRRSTAVPFGPPTTFSTTIHGKADLFAVDIGGVSGLQDLIAYGARYPAEASAELSVLRNPGHPRELLGSQADLRLAIGKNTPPNLSPSALPLTAGDTLAGRFWSPAGAYKHTAPLLAAQPYPTSVSLVPNTLFPDLHLSTFSAAQYPITVLYSGGSIPTAGLSGVLPESGWYFTAQIPMGLAGNSIRMQGFALAPSAGNPVFTATDGVDIEIQ